MVSLTEGLGGLMMTNFICRNTNLLIYVSNHIKYLILAYKGLWIPVI
jgi:hypothetical protein